MLSQNHMLLANSEKDLAPWCLTQNKSLCKAAA